MRHIRLDWRVATRTLTRTRRHAVLVVGAIAIPLFLSTAGVTVARSLELSPVRQLDASVGPAVAAFVDAYRWPNLIQSADGAVALGDNTDVPTPTVTEYEGRLRRALVPGQELIRWEGMSARWTTNDGRYRDGGALIETALGNQDVASALPLAKGSLPNQPGEVVVDHALAAQLDLTVGSTLTVAAPPGYQHGTVALPDTVVTVTGILAVIPGAERRLNGFGMPGTALTEPATVKGPPLTAWLITGTPVEWEQVQAINTVGSAVLSRTVLANPPPADLVAYGGAEPGIGTDDLVATVLIAIGLLALMALLVAPSFTVSASRSRHDLGLLSATGARRGDLSMIVALQGVAAGLAATAMGLSGGLALAALVRLVLHTTGSVAMPDLRVPWDAVSVFALVAVVSPAVAAWWPARKAAHDEPVAALSLRPSTVNQPRRRNLVVVVVITAGVLLVCAGGIARSAAILAAGSLVLFGGILLALGSLIGWIARAVPLLGPVGKYAVRDATRHRSRTVPAVAGVLAACALAVGVGTFVTSLNAHIEAAYQPPSGTGTIRVSIADLPGQDGQPVAELSSSQWTALTQALEHAVDLDGPVLPVSVGIAIGPDANPGGAWIDPVPVGPVTPPASSDYYHAASWAPTSQPNAPLIDDGTLIARSGLRGAAEAAEALAAGRVVVAQQGWIDARGEATFNVVLADSTDEVTAPAAAVNLGSSKLRLIVPPQLAQEFSLTTVQIGLLATATSRPDQDTLNAVDATLGAIVPGIGVAYEQGPATTSTGQLLILVAAAGLLALASSAMSAALAAADSMPDLATLSAVGAPRRLRRSISTAQSGVIVALGIGLGAPLGLVFAASLVAIRRYGGVAGADPTWQLHTPWAILAILVLAIPALTLAGTWLLTPRELPATRRIG